MDWETPTRWPKQEFLTHSPSLDILRHAQSPTDTSGWLPEGLSCWNVKLQSVFKVKAEGIGIFLFSSMQLYGHMARHRAKMSSHLKMLDCAVPVRWQCRLVNCKLHLLRNTVYADSSDFSVWSRVLVEKMMSSGPPGGSFLVTHNTTQLSAKLPLLIPAILHLTLYRVIHKSLRNFRTRLRNNQERQGRKEHINR